VFDFFIGWFVRRQRRLLKVTSVKSGVAARVKDFHARDAAPVAILIAAKSGIINR
jgi:hypothetical protein